MTARTEHYTEKLRNAVAESQQAIDAGPEPHELLAQLTAVLFQAKPTPLTIVVRPRNLEGTLAQRQVQIIVTGIRQERRTGLMLSGITVEGMPFEAYYSLDRRKGWFKLV